MQNHALNENKTASLSDGAKKTGWPHMRERIRCILITLQKKNTKWNKDINVKPEKQKVLEENRYLQKDICKGKDFSVKKLHFKRDLITLKRFCTAKGTTNENEAHIEDNICQSYMWWHTFWK